MTYVGIVPGHPDWSSFSAARGGGGHFVTSECGITLRYADGSHPPGLIVLEVTTLSPYNCEVLIDTLDQV